MTLRKQWRGDEEGQRSTSPPPGSHLIIDGIIDGDRPLLGPRENNARPTIDPMMAPSRAQPDHVVRLADMPALLESRRGRAGAGSESVKYEVNPMFRAI